MSDNRYTVIQFNFCSEPFCKDNVKRINVEVEDRYTIKEALNATIDIFNERYQENLKNETNLFKIKLSKKSGLPDTDLPGKKH